MRLWHELLIPYLPRQQLLGQHRECCALRGNGWGKPHSVVNYVFKYSRAKLALYHLEVLFEMQRRGYNVDQRWLNLEYRGKSCAPDTMEEVALAMHDCELDVWMRPVYAEHNAEYMRECLLNLREKGIKITEEKLMRYLYMEEHDPEIEEIMQEEDRAREREMQSMWL